MEQHGTSHTRLLWQERENESRHKLNKLVLKLLKCSKSNSLDVINLAITFSAIIGKADMFSRYNN